MPSFGYTDIGGGTGGNRDICFWTLVGTFPWMPWYPFTNTTGSPVFIDTATLYHVNSSNASSVTVGIYDSIDWPGGNGTGLRGESNVLAGLVAGTNTFTFATPILVMPGGRVWTVLRAYGGSPFVNCSLVTRQDEGVQTHNNPNNALPSFFPQQGWIRSNIVLPIDLSGSSSGTLPPTNLRESLIVNEPLTEGVPDIREALIVNEPLAEGVPNLRNSLFVNEPLAEGIPNLRCSLMVLETLHPVEPEPFMATEILPTLKGLSFNVTKAPTFSTRKPRSSSGRSVRNSLMKYPIWKFKFSYDYLPDKPVSVGQTSLKQLVGFFLDRQGSFDEWLYLDPDDNSTVGAVIGTGDGATLQYYLSRSFGSSRPEPVGQYNPGPAPLVVYYTDAEAHSVPPNPGPYTVTVTHSADFQEDLGVTIGGTALTKVSGSPGAMQYAVTAGVYTFNAAQHDVAAVITYRYTASGADYSVTLPNLLIFGGAVPLGRIITADFHFYYRVIFSDDAQEYDKFMDKLWELQEMNFESVP
jgi:hypothetical protein